MSAIARGGTVTDFDSLPPAYRRALEENGVNSQRDADGLTPDQARQVIRDLIQRVDDARAGRHPLGDGADPGKDYRKQSVRDALKYCLRLYFAGGLALSVNSHEDARVGMRLADKFISHLEISLAMDQLAASRPDLHILLTLRYRERWENKKIAGRLRIGRNTVKRHEDEALDWLIDLVWRDEQAS